MAIQQTQTWRIREAINKKIERQLQQGITPLTIYKTFFPFEAGGDIIDRRTGKIKTVQTFVQEQIKAEIGSRKAFIAKQRKSGVSTYKAGKLWEQRVAYFDNKRAEKVEQYKRTYETKVQVLAEMDITSTRQAKEYQVARLDEVRARFLMSFDPSKPGYYDAVKKIEEMPDDQFLSVVREAGRRTYAGKGPRTASFHKTMAEIMGLPDPEPNTP